MNINYNNKNSVSIGLPTHNGASRGIKKALDSLLAQNYENFELIISDNASVDDTEKVCRHYAEKDKRIKYFRQNENLGQLKNFDFVFTKAKGEYFMWASDDDWWEPTFISTLKSILDNNPDYDVAMSSVRSIYEDGVLYGEVRFGGNNNLTNLNYNQVFTKIVINRQIFHYFLFGLYRTDMLRKVLSRPLPYCFNWDRVFLGEIALATHFYSIPDILYTKIRANQSVVERYADDEIGKAYRNNKKIIQYVFTVWQRILTSKAIPHTRKIKALAFLLKLLWRFKRKILLESVTGRGSFSSNIGERKQD